MIARTKALGAALAGALLLPAAPAAAEWIPPVDEAAQDPALLAVRDALIAAVRAHDVDAVIAHADPNIRLGFGDMDGIAQFRADLEAPYSKFYWQALLRTLELGGVFFSGDPDTFCTPYPSCIDLGPEADPFFTAVITRPDAAVRTAPDPAADVMLRLHYEQVELTNITPDHWAVVTFPGSRVGYIAESDYQTPAGWRAFFNRVDGEWVLTMFLAGD